MTSCLVSPVSNFKSSISFYQKLNFEIIEKGAIAYAVSKGLVIEINPVRYTRPGIRFFSDTWSDIVKKIDSITKVTETEDGYLFSDLNGTWIYLSNQGDNDIPSKANEIIPLTGNYAGMSLETTDIHKTLSIYKCLGFKEGMGSPDQGWMTITGADDLTISLMKPNSCPHLFFNPSMTFFNGKENLRIIASLREAGVEFAEEITYFNKEGIVDNVIIRDPGGYGFFIFSD